MLVWEIWKSQADRLGKTMAAMLMRGRAKASLDSEALEAAIVEGFRHGLMAADGFIEAEIKAGNLIRK